MPLLELFSILACNLNYSLIGLFKCFVKPHAFVAAILDFSMHMCNNCPTL